MKEVKNKIIPYIKKSWPKLLHFFSASTLPLLKLIWNEKIQIFLIYQYDIENSQRLINEQKINALCLLNTLGINSQMHNIYFLFTHYIYFLYPHIIFIFYIYILYLFFIFTYYIYFFYIHMLYLFFIFTCYIYFFIFTYYIYFLYSHVIFIFYIHI